ncbi:MAG: alpha/beta hydrolase [Rhodothermia bacterium]|nr:alpha/beta hydrolase [Rhodothermia bacterium]
MVSRKIRGTHLEVLEHGAGEPLVLVHGSVSDVRTWSKVAPRLGQMYRTVSYSRRYHWPNASIAAGEDYSMDEQAADLEALLSGLEGGSAHVVGHSYGGYLALLVAMRASARIKRLVLMEPPVLPLVVSIPPKPIELLRLLFSEPNLATSIIRFAVSGLGPATQAVKSGNREKALRYFGSAVLGKRAFHDLSEERLEQARSNFIDAEFLGSGFSELPHSQVANIPHPTLLVQGENSRSLFPLLLNQLEELIPATQRSTIPAASHNMHEDNPDAFVHEVTAFLGQG